MGLQANLYFIKMVKAMIVSWMDSVSSILTSFYSFICPQILSCELPTSDEKSEQNNNDDNI